MFTIKNFATTALRTIIFIGQAIAALFIELYVLNHLEPIKQSNQSESAMNLFQLLINNMGIIIAIILLGLLLFQLWYWHNKDEQLKRKDLIKTLIKVVEVEKRLTVNSISNHVKGLKDNFITPLKKALKKDELDKDKLIELLEYEFDNHTTAFTDTKNIDELIERLKLHESGKIIHDIRYENVKATEKT